MTKPLTKEQRAELWQLANNLNPCPSWVYTLLKSHALVDEALEIATAKLATARVCEECGGKGKRLINNCVAGTVATYEIKCPHCTNGVVYSDERARELLERLKRAEEALDTMPVQAMAIIGPPYTVTFSPSAFELIRAARAKEGKNDNTRV